MLTRDKTTKATKMVTLSTALSDLSVTSI